MVFMHPVASRAATGSPSTTSRTPSAIRSTRRSRSHTWCSTASSSAFRGSGSWSRMAGALFRTIRPAWITCGRRGRMRAPSTTTSGRSRWGSSTSTRSPRPRTARAPREPVGRRPYGFGTDYPYDMGWYDPRGFVEGCAFLKDGDKAKILGLNAWQSSSSSPGASNRWGFPRPRRAQSAEGRAPPSSRRGHGKRSGGRGAVGHVRHSVMRSGESTWQLKRMGSPSSIRHVNCSLTAPFANCD